MERALHVFILILSGCSLVSALMCYKCDGHLYNNLTEDGELSKVFHRPSGYCTPDTLGQLTSIIPCNGTCVSVLIVTNFSIEFRGKPLWFVGNTYYHYCDIVGHGSKHCTKTVPSRDMNRALKDAKQDLSKYNGKGSVDVADATWCQCAEEDLCHNDFSSAPEGDGDSASGLQFSMVAMATLLLSGICLKL